MPKKNKTKRVSKKRKPMFSLKRAKKRIVSKKNIKN